MKNHTYNGSEWVPNDKKHVEISDTHYYNGSEWVPKENKDTFEKKSAATKK